MKIVVIGAGAIGGLLASFLCEAGAQVSVVARGAKLQALRAGGLRLQAGDTVRTASPELVAAVADAQQAEIVIVAVKAHDLDALAADLARLAARGSLILFAMNGIPCWLAERAPRKADDVADGDSFLCRLAPETVAWGTVYAGAEAQERSLIVNTTPGRNRLVIGRRDDGQDERLLALSGLLTRAGLPTSVSPRIASEIWSKLASIVSIAPLAALTDGTNRQVCESPALRATARTLIEEAVAIGTALGIATDIDIDARLDPSRHTHHPPSLLQDFRAGRRVEIDNGLLRLRDLAKRCAVAAPTLELIAGLVEAKALHLGLRGAHL